MMTSRQFQGYAWRKVSLLCAAAMLSSVLTTRTVSADGVTRQRATASTTKELRALQDEVKTLRTELRHVRTTLEEIRKTLREQSTPSEFSPVTIRLQTESGQPVAGFKTLLSLRKSDRPVIVKGVTDENGLGIQRSLPYGIYSLDISGPDGWTAYDRNLLEVGAALNRTVITPDIDKRVKVTFRTDFDPSGLKGLKFGERHEASSLGGYSVPYSPNPGEESRDFKTFPAFGNGIKDVGVLLELQVERSIEQPDGSHLTWKWAFRDRQRLPDMLAMPDQILTVTERESEVVDSTSSGTYFQSEEGEEFRVAYQVLQTSAPAAHAVSIEVAPGELEVTAEKFLGRPDSQTIKALQTEPELSHDIWLEANVKPKSAWITRSLHLPDWENTDKFGRLAASTFSVKSDSELSIPIRSSPLDTD